MFERNFGTPWADCSDETGSHGRNEHFWNRVAQGKTPKKYRYTKVLSKSPTSKIQGRDLDVSPPFWELRTQKTISGLTGIQGILSKAQKKIPNPKNRKIRLFRIFLLFRLSKPLNTLVAMANQGGCSALFLFSLKHRGSTMSVHESRISAFIDSQFSCSVFKSQDEV